MAQISYVLAVTLRLVGRVLICIDCWKLPKILLNLVIIKFYILFAAGSCHSYLQLSNQIIAHCSAYDAFLGPHTSVTV